MNKFFKKAAAVLLSVAVISTASGCSKESKVKQITDAYMAEVIEFDLEGASEYLAESNKDVFDADFSDAQEDAIRDALDGATFESINSTVAGSTAFVEYEISLSDSTQTLTIFLDKIDGQWCVSSAPSTLVFLENLAEGVEDADADVSSDDSDEANSEEDNLSPFDQQCNIIQNVISDLDNGNIDEALSYFTSDQSFTTPEVLCEAFFFEPYEFDYAEGNNGIVVTFLAPDMQYVMNYINDNIDEAMDNGLYDIAYEAETENDVSMESYEVFAEYLASIMQDSSTPDIYMGYEVCFDENNRITNDISSFFYMPTLFTINTIVNSNSSLLNLTTRFLEEGMISQEEADQMIMFVEAFDTGEGIVYMSNAENETQPVYAGITDPSIDPVVTIVMTHGTRYEDCESYDIEGMDAFSINIGDEYFYIYFTTEASYDEGTTASFTVASGSNEYISDGVAELVPGESNIFCCRITSENGPIEVGEYEINLYNPHGAHSAVVFVSITES